MTLLLSGALAREAATGGAASCANDNHGLLGLLPLRSALARGALFAAGAHGIGVAKAHEVGPGEGSIAGLMLVLIGVTILLLARSSCTFSP